MITPAVTTARRTTGARFPDFPELPPVARSNEELVAWHAVQREMWDQFRLCLDRVGLGSDRSGAVLAPLLQSGSQGYSVFGGSGAGGLSGQPPVLTVGIAQRTPTTATALRERGQKIFYQPNEPEKDQDPRENDLWFDTDDNFRLWEYHEGRWVSVFDTIPTLRGVFGLDMETRANALLVAANARAELLIDTKMAAVKTSILSEQGLTESIANEFSVVNAALGDAFARITRERNARVTATEALAEEISTVEARIGEAEGDIVSERSVRAEADGSVIARIANSLTVGGGATQTSGTLIIGAVYKITGNTGGADFTGVGAPSNAVNTTFTATGTAPVWGAGSLQETRLASVQTWGAARVTAEGNLASEYVLDVSTVGASGYRKATGFRVTTQGGGTTGESEFVLQADKFVFVTSSPTELSSGLLDYTPGPPARGGTYVISQAGGDFTNVGAPSNAVNTRFTATGTTPNSWGTGKLLKLHAPFRVTGDTVYIDRAAITEVTAGSILAGTISAAIKLTAPEICSTPLVSYSTGSGFWMGTDGGTAKFRIGDPAGKHLKWDGAALTLKEASLDSPEITSSVLRLLVDSTICGRTSKDGILRVNGGGGDGQSQGGQVDVLGNSYTTVAGYEGSVLVTPGNHANSTVRIRDRTGSDRIQVLASGMIEFHGNPALAPVGGADGAWNAIDFNQLRFLGVASLSCRDISALAISSNNEDITAGTGSVNAAEFKSGGTKVVGSRGSSVGNADSTTVSTTLTTGTFAGVDTISLSALVSYLNALGVCFNGNAVLQNTLRDRLKATGGHGLISD